MLMIFPSLVPSSHAAAGTSFRFTFLFTSVIFYELSFFTVLFTCAAARTSFPICTAAGTVSACPRAAAAASPVLYYNPDRGTKPDQYHSHNHIICRFHTNPPLSRLSDKTPALRFTASAKPILLCKQQICHAAEKESLSKEDFIKDTRH